MADEYNIKIAIEAQTESLKKVQNAVEQINQSVQSANKQFSNAGKVWTGAFMEIGAQITDLAIKVPSAVGKTIQAFGEEEVAINKLAVAIRSQGGDVLEVLPIMQELASEMQRITVYADDQILGMQGVASSMGVSAEQMESVVKSAIGLSAALGMDMTTATKAASAAIQGKTELLTRYIPTLSLCQTTEEKYAKVQELSRNGFAQAKAEGDSTLGMLKKCANAWGDLSEVLGSTFAPMAIDVANALKFVCEWFSKHDTLTRTLTISLSSLALGFAFTKIGGLANVAALFKLVGSGMTTAKVASDRLNASLRANPIGLVVSAVSAFAMTLSYLKSKEKERYEQNIEQSKEYRTAIESEIDILKQYGATTEESKKRSSEITTEINKLNKELGSIKGREQVFAPGVSGKVYTLEEQKAIDNLKAKIATLEKLQKEYRDTVNLNAKAVEAKVKVDEQASQILEESVKKIAGLKDEWTAYDNLCKALTDTTNRLSEAEKEYANNPATSKKVALANEIASLRQKELDLTDAIAKQAVANDENARAKENLNLAERKMHYELLLQKAKEDKNKQAQEEYSKNLTSISQEIRLNELIEERMSAVKDLIKTEADLVYFREKAEKYSEFILKQEIENAKVAKGKVATEKWLNSEVEKSKQHQRDLELDILRARASGNEKLAQEKEEKLRIAQLSSEIFEYSRKEGMSRKDLEKLQKSANQQAKDRYRLEKSITDEVKRQNLAKNAQARIEDILITNKIEQLKAEGNLAAAKELEQERDLQRQLASLEEVSEADKKELANIIRQTNAYRNSQDNNQVATSGMSQDYSRSSIGGRTYFVNTENTGRSYSPSENNKKQTSTLNGYDNVMSMSIRGTVGTRLPSRRKGETQGEANARFAREQEEKNQKRENRNKEREMLNILSPYHRIRYNSMTAEQKKVAMGNFYKNRSPETKTNEKSVKRSLPNVSGMLSSITEKANKMSGVNEARKEPQKNNVDNKKEDQPQKESQSPMERNLAERGAYNTKGTDKSESGTLRDILAEVRKIRKSSKVQAEE